MSSQADTNALSAEGQQPQRQEQGSTGASAAAIPPKVPLDTKVPVEQLMGAVHAIRQHHEAEVAAHRQQEAQAAAAAAAAGGDAAAAAPAAADGCGAGGCEGSGAEAGSADGKPLGYPGTVRAGLQCATGRLLAGRHYTNWRGGRLCTPAQCEGVDDAAWFSNKHVAALPLCFVLRSAVLPGGAAQGRGSQHPDPHVAPSRPPLPRLSPRPRHAAVPAPAGRTWLPSGTGCPRIPAAGEQGGSRAYSG